jgi:hypothetical protein
MEISTQINKEKVGGYETCGRVRIAAKPLRG